MAADLRRHEVASGNLGLLEIGPGETWETLRSRPPSPRETGGSISCSRSVPIRCAPMGFQVASSASLATCPPGREEALLPSLSVETEDSEVLVWGEEVALCFDMRLGTLTAYEYQDMPLYRRRTAAQPLARPHRQRRPHDGKGVAGRRP